jgi:exosortase
MPSWAWLSVPGVLAVALYAPLFPRLVAEWVEFPNLSHGFAIPLIAGYLLWARWHRERLPPPVMPTAWGLPLLIVGLGALVVGLRGDEPFVARVSLPVTLIGLALFLGGWEVARVAWPGLAYLVFMIPLPWTLLKQVTYRSRLFDATISTQALQWLDVPVHRDGVILYLPNVVLEVADTCSSIPAIAALLSLGVAYASLALAIRLLLVVATLPLAIAANIIRIISVAWAAYAIGPWTLKTAFHMFNGTANFLVTFGLLLAFDAGLALLWRRGAR